MPMSPDSKDFMKIEDFLFRNSPKPGERVSTEDEVIKALGITRYKARQAFDLLVQMGVLERTKRKGTIVKRLATKDMALNILEQFKLAAFDEIEFNEARLIIECAVLPFVAMRLTPAMISKMKRLIENIKKHSDSPLVADSYLLQFHLTMLESCGNRIIEVFSSVLRIYFKSTVLLLEDASSSFYIERAEYCNQLLSALSRKDVPLATKLLTTMINNNGMINNVQET